MNIEGLLDSGVGTAFRLLKDLVTLGTYNQAVPLVGLAPYDPITGMVTSPAQIYENVRMIFTTVDAEELVGTMVTTTDVKILVPAMDLPGVTPSGEDHVFAKGVRYNIVRPKQIPGNALHILYGRAA